MVCIDTSLLWTLGPFTLHVQRAIWNAFFSQYARVIRDERGGTRGEGFKSVQEVFDLCAGCKGSTHWSTISLMEDMKEIMLINPCKEIELFMVLQPGLWVSNFLVLLLHVRILQGLKMQSLLIKSVLVFQINTPLCKYR